MEGKLEFFWRLLEEGADLPTTTRIVGLLLLYGPMTREELKGRLPEMGVNSLRATVHLLKGKGRVYEEDGRLHLPKPLEEAARLLRGEGVRVASEEAVLRVSEAGQPKAPRGRSSRRREGKEQVSSPLEALSQAHPHVRNLLLALTKRLPAVGQPMAASEPEALVAAAEAASVYGKRALPTLVLWLPMVRGWVREHGKEEVVEVLREAAKRAREPFPYAEKILKGRSRRRSERALVVEAEDLVEF